MTEEPNARPDKNADPASEQAASPDNLDARASDAQQMQASPFPAPEMDHIDLSDGHPRPRPCDE